MKPLTSIMMATLVVISANVTADSNVAGQIAKESLEIVFSESEKKLIREFFGEQAGESGEKSKSKSKKNSKAGGKKVKGSLPPGLQRQLEKNGTLPPGLQKKALPPGLESSLPAAPKGYERVVVDTDVLLVETASGIVRDIVRDALK